MSISSIKQKTVTLVATICSTVALFADVSSTGNLSRALNGTGIAQFIVFCALLYAYDRFLFGKKEMIEKVHSRERTLYAVLAVIFSLCMVIGKAQWAHEDLKYPFLAVVLFVGYVPLFWMILMYIGKMTDAVLQKKTVRTTGKVTDFVFEKHSILAPMMCVLLCRIPYWIAFFPCSMTWDGGAQISSYYGIEPFNDHHPPLLSFLYGGIAWNGSKWGVSNAAMFLIVFMQSLLTAYAVANVCRLMKKMFAPYWIRWVTLLYFALFTVWNIFDCTVIKDTLYYPLTMLFTVKLIEMLLEKERFFEKKANLLAYVIYAVGMAQVRNNGIFVLLFVTPFLLVVLPKKKKINCAVMTLFAVLVIYGLNHVIYPGLGVVKLEDKVDTYCIFYQQTAKYAKEHPDDVTEQEREVLDTLFEYDKLGESYEPRLADWVKNCLRIQEGSEKDPTGHVFATLKNDYLKVWFAQFLRHPWTYIEGFLECSYTYYFPEERVYTEGLGFYEDCRITFTPSMSAAAQSQNMAPIRFLLEQISKLEFVPGIGMLYRCGFYTWLVMFAVIWLCIQKRYRSLIAVVPAIVNILVCMISPVNACIRYVLPTMCMIPILLAVMYTREID